MKSETSGESIAIVKLKKLCGKFYLKLTVRGNAAIDLALGLAKKLGKKTVLIPDQGGWIHYQKAPPKLGFAIVEVKTDYGIVNIEDLEKKASDDSIFLCNSMPGYFVLDDIDAIYEICKKKSCILVNDTSGSIGSENSKAGDIIIGSFGEWKPLDVGYGGFIATDDKKYFDSFAESEFDNSHEKKLLSEIDGLAKKLEAIAKQREKIISDLRSFDILFRDGDGINVIVLYSSDEEKKKILSYCSSNALEFTECPRYIRILEKAISIELKRV